MSRVLLALLLVATSCFAAEPFDLCGKQEKVLFGCSVGRKVAAVCASTEATSNTGYVQYRFGTKEHIEALIPKARVAPAGNFFFSHADYSGGDHDQLRLRRGEDEYIFFHSTTRTGFDAAGTNNPVESAGFYVVKNGAPGKVHICSNFMGFGEQANQLPREESGRP